MTYSTLDLSSIYEPLRIEFNVFCFCNVLILMLCFHVTVTKYFVKISSNNRDSAPKPLSISVDRKKQEYLNYLFMVNILQLLKWKRFTAIGNKTDRSLTKTANILGISERST